MNRPNIIRSILILLQALFSLSCWSASYLFFDEDDPLGADYYDGGIGTFRAPSSLLLGATSADKLPITTNAFRGECAALLEWNSKAGGDWKMRIYNRGFAVKNISEYKFLELKVNGPLAISAKNLPQIKFQDSAGNESQPLPLDKHLQSGLDADIATWQSILIPLNFAEEQRFNPTNFLSFNLTQREADGIQHQLWIDQIEFKKEAKPSSAGKRIVPRWTLLRSGDQAVQLHWSAENAEEGQAYHIYRTGGRSIEAKRITARPIFTTHFADLDVENGQKYSYRIEAVGAGNRTSEESSFITPKPFENDDQFLEFIQATAFDYFWFESDPGTGLVRDRSESWSPCSIAAVGFGLTAIGIGINHGWITRDQGRERTLRILSSLSSTPQGPEARDTSGYKGWYYHFIDAGTGLRFGNSELSSIDTALLLAGVLYSAEYFNGNEPKERRIQELSHSIFNRLDWKWMLDGGDTLSMGWHPGQGFISTQWQGYNEASILYVLALGSGALERQHWEAWTKTYEWKQSYGFEFIHFPPLFGHQYSACWIDLRNIADAYTAARGITYFENSRRATLAQRAYAIANPKKHSGYGANLWGFTACDGPGSNGYFGYIARGAPPPENDDGTIAPTAAGGSIPFTPEESLACLKEMYQQYRTQLWGPYGFQDAFNLEAKWFARNVIGIDQGTILIMIENHRTGSVWKKMSQNPSVRTGLRTAGFRPVIKFTPEGK